MALSTDAIGEIARRHGFDEAAGLALAQAMEAGGGSMAQFSHPALGGMGQWSRGGMLMIGAMSDDGLKARVGALANDLASAMQAEGDGSGARSSAGRGTASGPQDGGPSPATPPSHTAADWWPGDLGRPGASGAQNGIRYAVFPQARRLAIERGGRVEVHDTGEHRISGVSQQQGPGSTLRFTSQTGTVDLESLPKL